MPLAELFSGPVPGAPGVKVEMAGAQDIELSSCFPHQEAMNQCTLSGPSFLSCNPAVINPLYPQIPTPPPASLVVSEAQTQHKVCCVLDGGCVFVKSRNSINSVRLRLVGNFCGSQGQEVQPSPGVTGSPLLPLTATLTLSLRPGGLLCFSPAPASFSPGNSCPWRDLASAPPMST